MRESLSTRIAQGKNIIYELLEEIAALPLLINGLDGLAGSDHFVKVQPLWN
jgi:hypothetical protein